MVDATGLFVGHCVLVKVDSSRLVSCAGCVGNFVDEKGLEFARGGKICDPLVKLTGIEWNGRAVAREALRVYWRSTYHSLLTSTGCMHFKGRWRMEEWLAGSDLN